MKIDSAAVLAAPGGAPAALPYPLRQVDARPGGLVAPNGSLLDATGRGDGDVVCTGCTGDGCGFTHRADIYCRAFANR